MIRRAIIGLLVLVAMLPAAVAQRAGLVINELLYQPAAGGAEYVELYNAGEAAADRVDEPAVAEYHVHGGRILHTYITQK